MNYRFNEWKIISIFVLVFILVQGGSYFVIAINTNRIAIENTSQGLETGSQVLRDLLALRASQLSLSTQVLAADPVFVAAMQSGDESQIGPTLKLHLERLGAAVIVITSENQELIALAKKEASLPKTDWTDINPAVLSASLGEREIMPLDKEQQTLFQVISAPLLFRDSVARLSIAYSVGDPLWQNIGNSANTEFMFLFKNSDQAWAEHASSFPAVLSQAILQEYNQGNVGIKYYQLGDYEYSFQEVLLTSTENTELYAMVGKSIELVTEPFSRLQRAIFSSTVVALMLSVLCVVLVTRRFVAPLNTLAHVDNLTGVANRRLLDLSLQTLCSQPIGKAGPSFALLMADLDSFKHINDECGHDAGDIVLQTIARRFLNGVRRSDLVARYGGDEFAVLLCGVNEDTVRQILVTLQESLKRPIRIGERDLAVGVSIGVAMCPQHGNSVAELQRKADCAMYAAKSLDEQYAFFESSMERDFTSRRN